MPARHLQSYNLLDQTSSVTPTGLSGLSQTYAGLVQAQRLSSGGTSFVNPTFGVDSESAASGVSFTDDPDGANLGERVGSTPYYFLHDALESWWA